MRNFNFQVSLILELCSLGNLRDFLVDHQREFIAAWGKDNAAILQFSKSKGSKFGQHSLFLWSYQVRNQVLNLNDRNCLFITK